MEQKKCAVQTTQHTLAFSSNGTQFSFTRPPQIHFAHNVGGHGMVPQNFVLPKHAVCCVSVCFYGQKAYYYNN